MVVKRIVTDIAVTRTADATAFYVDLLGMKPVMDQGWILTLASEESAPPRISFATEGGSGTKVPDLSVEVDDVDAIHAKAEAAGGRLREGRAAPGIRRREGSTRGEDRVTAHRRRRSAQCRSAGWLEWDSRLSVSA